jgi:hypothetical protein
MLKTVTAIAVPVLVSFATVVAGTVAGNYATRWLMAPKPEPTPAPKAHKA